ALVRAPAFPGPTAGELLIKRGGRVQPFNVLQQRLTRKTVSDKLTADFPAHLRAYDLLVDGSEDVRDRPFPERRARLEALVAGLDQARVDLSPLIAFAPWDELIVARNNPAAAGGGQGAGAVEGVAL